MGFYVRKSLRAGPFRVDLSRHGIDMSAGVPGFSAHAGPRGSYVRVSAAGASYQTTLSPSPRPTRHGQQQTPLTQPPFATPGDHLLEDIAGASVAQLAASSSSELLANLNRAAGRFQWWKPVAVITVLATLLTLGVPGLAGVLLVLGAEVHTVLMFSWADAPTWFAHALSEMSGTAHLR